jgi:hypothetical protein
MDLSTYEDLSGTTVKDSQRNRISAYIDRTRGMLESMLGYTLDPSRVTQNLYTETGKVQVGETFAFDWFDTNTPTDLLDPDAVVGAYRLFNYDPRDEYLSLDPFSTVNALKLVRSGITYYTFDAASYRVQVERDGLTKYIVISPWLRGWRLQWLTEWQRNGLQFAVDADWLWAKSSDIPDRLLFLWSDMVTFYSNPKNNIKSETVGTHNYSKFNYTPPETLDMNAQVLRELAGPYGTVGKVPIA